MARKSGTVIQKGETYSDKYEGFISKGNGIYRKPFKWINKKGRTRSVNRYCVEVPCTICGEMHLTDRNNYRKSQSQLCSESCSTVYKSNPEGTRKRKHGSESDSYILTKRPNHPHADRVGYVPEHRLIVEEALGRHLKKSEKVHHINCRKDDNRIENLFVCANSSDHNAVHASLNKCVAQLIEKGVLEFDEASKSYRAADAVLISHYGLSLRKKI